MRTQLWRGAVMAAAVAIPFATIAIAAEEKKAERKPPSACVGLDVTACGTKAECMWKQQVTTKAGKVRRAHCRKRPYQQVAKKTA